MWGPQRRAIQNQYPHIPGDDDQLGAGRSPVTRTFLEVPSDRAPPLLHVYPGELKAGISAHTKCGPCSASKGKEGLPLVTSWVGPEDVMPSGRSPPLKGKRRRPLFTCSPKSTESEKLKRHEDWHGLGKDRGATGWWLQYFRGGRGRALERDRVLTAQPRIVCCARPIFYAVGL